MVLKDIRGQQHCTMAVSFCFAKGFGINSCITLTAGGDRASYWPVCVSSACLSACVNEGQHDLALRPRRAPASSSLVFIWIQRWPWWEQHRFYLLLACKCCLQFLVHKKHARSNRRGSSFFFSLTSPHVVLFPAAKTFFFLSQFTVEKVRLWGRQIKRNASGKTIGRNCVWAANNAPQSPLTLIKLWKTKSDFLLNICNMSIRPVEAGQSSHTHTAMGVLHLHTSFNVTVSRDQHLRCAVVIQSTRTLINIKPGV